MPSTKTKVVPATALSYDINSFKLDAGMPLYDNAEKYLSVKMSCLASRRVEHDVQQELREATAYLTAMQGPTLLERAEFGDPEAMLEMAVRSAVPLGLSSLLRLSFPPDILADAALVRPATKARCGSWTL